MGVVLNPSAGDEGERVEVLWTHSRQALGWSTVLVKVGNGADINDGSFHCDEKLLRVLIRDKHDKKTWRAVWYRVRRYQRG